MGERGWGRRGVGGGGGMGEGEWGEEGTCDLGPGGLDKTQTTSDFLQTGSSPTKARFTYYLRTPSRQCLRQSLANCRC